jgi:hypothetical protein
MRNKLVAWVAAVFVIGLAPSATAQETPKQHPPIIDMHLHALPAKGWHGGPSKMCPGMNFAAYDPKTKWDPDHMWETCPNPLYPAATDDELLK